MQEGERRTTHGHPARPVGGGRGGLRAGVLVPREIALRAPRRPPTRWRHFVPGSTHLLAFFTAPRRPSLASFRTRIHTLEF